jgi:hypothetical protein
LFDEEKTPEVENLVTLSLPQLGLLQIGSLTKKQANLSWRWQHFNLEPSEMFRTI